MIRKLSIIGLAALFAVALALPAMAGITGTAHTHTKEGGPCAVCHLPHGAAQGANRLWPSTVSGVTGVQGDVALLCAYCHNTAGGATGITGAPTSDTWVYGTNSHGQYMSAAANAAPRGFTTGGFPYQNDGTVAVIECTSCHDVHNDPIGKRPFLRGDLNAICSNCHMNRRFESGAVEHGTAANATAGTWGSLNVGLNNPGSHPVGTDITGNTTGGNTPVTIPAILHVPYSASPFDWVMGGHLTGGHTGGVTCVTCHAVHGIHFDSSYAEGNIGITAANNDDPNSNFLAVYQSSNITDAVGGVNRTVASGGGDWDRLCEACHLGTAPNASYNATFSTGDPTATHAPNPGGTAYGHPVYDMEANNDWVTAFPGTWVAGADVGANPDPTPICESCHTPHPLANAGGRDNSGYALTTSDYILRTSQADVCTGCHTNSIAGHHPVAITFSAGAAVNYLDFYSAAGSYNLQCGTCHTGGGGAAHNWTSDAALALDPAWKPYNNARTVYFAASMSITCMDCHYGIDNNQITMSPTLHDGLNTAYDGSADIAYNGALGQGTHFIGAFSQARYRVLNAAIDPYTDSFTAYGGPIGSFSRHGGANSTAPVLVCESCHELQPGKNSGWHLLLGKYQEEGDLTVPTAPQTTRNGFCEACHLPSGTHPLSGQTVTRTNAALDVDVTDDWVNTPNDTNVILVNGTDIINCDSCHQPHDAATLSYTFIIDTAVTLGTPAALAKRTVGAYTSAYATSRQTTKGDYSEFCDECHPYK